MTMMACWRLPLLAEFCHDTYPYETYPLTDIAGALKDERQTVERNYRTVTEHLTFRRCVEGAS
jgi:hypothetical protein